MSVTNSMSRQEKRKFLQSKYDYYAKFNTWSVIVATLAQVTYFVSDCQLFDRVAWETLLPRVFMLFPLAIFVLISRRVKDYRIMVPLSYLMIHGIMWCTIWAIYYLPIKQHASEGFIIMHLMFFAIGYSASFLTSTIAHSLVIANIILSHQFNHYENFDLMLSLGIPCMVAVCAVNFIMGKVYLDHYNTKNQLETLITMDPLTQVFNRNKIDDIVTNDGKRLAYSAEIDVAVLVIDIDLFKNINDTYGHEEGDKVIVFIADTIKESVRSIDIIIRWGGEEFVVILPECSLGNARSQAEKIRSAVENSPDNTHNVTVSIGLSMYKHDNFLHAVTDADKALYAAKESGRNKVIFYEDMGENYGTKSERA